MSRINTNINSFQAMRAMQRNQGDLSTRLARLSTGLRINTGKDDPSGLIASETLRSEMNGIGKAIDNTNRASNVINTAEGALNEVSSLLNQVQSLVLEAANTGALSDDEIKANQLQLDSILNSINRIANTTEFGGRKLLDGSLDYVTAGVIASAVDVATINSAKIPDNGSITVTIEVVASAQLGTITYGGGAVGAGGVTLEVAGKDGIEQISIASGTAVTAIASAVNQLTTATGVSAIVSGTDLVFNSVAYGSDQFVAVKALAGSFTTNTAKDFGGDAAVLINGSEADVDGITASLRTSNLDLTLTLDSAFATMGAVSGTTSSFDITGGGAKFQIGSKVERNGQINIGIQSLSTSSLGNSVTGFLASLGSGEDNSLVSGNTIQAQKIIDKAIQQVSFLRGRLGALQKNVLETNVNSLGVALENVTASESAIRDADFAKETAALTRAQILTQANTSVLSQANASPQSVLSLLQ
jgi:flagellin